MPDKMSTGENGAAIPEQAAPPGEPDGETWHARALSITEAVLLSIVALTAAWSGYAAAKWGTESSLQLAKASALRTQANRADLENMSVRSLDASTFNAWFTAHIAGDKNEERIAIKRFRPGYRLAFDAWIATNPDTNPNAPPGPQYMPQYEQPLLARSRLLDLQADALYDEGSKAAGNSDDYVRITIVLASVLFLVGISSHFPLVGARYALIALAGLLLILSAALLLRLPGPPT